MKRKTTEDFLIDETPMLTPDAGIGIKCADIENDATGVDECGVMHRMLARTNVKTWNFSYAVLTAEEYAYTMNLLKGKETFRFTFKDEAGNPETVIAYCKEVSTSYWSKRQSLYKNLQFSVIQC